MKVFIIFGTLAATVIADAAYYPNGCPTNHTIYHNIGHPSNCTLFYICNNGVPVQMKCPANLHYNNSTQTCDYPERAGCNVNGSNYYNARNEFYPNGCPLDYTLEILLPHPVDCSKYFVCDHEELVLQQCPEELHFNKDSQACDWKATAGCQLPNGCPADFTKELLLPHPTNCGQYYSCNNGLLILQECPPDLHFNKDKQICDWKESAGCVVNSPEEVN